MTAMVGCWRFSVIVILSETKNLVNDSRTVDEILHYVHYDKEFAPLYVTNLVIGNF